MTSIEWIIQQIEEEIQVLGNLYGSEIKGRLIALHFAKRRCEQAKEMHKQEIIEAYCNGNDLIGAEQYYQETFKNKTI